MSNLDVRIAELAAKYLPLASEMLKEAIRIPADYVDKPVDQGGDPACGTSNHEFPRLEYLRNKVIEIKAVRKPEDAFFDDYYTRNEGLSEAVASDFTVLRAPLPMSVEVDLDYNAQSGAATATPATAIDPFQPDTLHSIIKAVTKVILTNVS